MEPRSEIFDSRSCHPLLFIRVFVLFERLSHSVFLYADFDRLIAFELIKDQNHETANFPFRMMSLLKNFLRMVRKPFTCIVLFPFFKHYFVLLTSFLGEKC